MTLKETILSMRMKEFGFAKVHYLGQPDKDVFPQKIDIVKWVTLDEPMRVFDLEMGRHKYITEYSYTIAQLEWDAHEDWWDFKSIGTRYLKDGTEDLSKWILDFCGSFAVDDSGELYEVTE